MAYPRAVKRALILFGFVLLFAACGGSAPQPAAAPKPALQVAPASPPVLATGCRAQPGTIYGDEPVAFDIQAPSSTRADVELFDASGRSLLRDSVMAPGQWRPTPVPSGDFSLKLAKANVSCQVTVNRELSRASQTAR
jgi:hypothetical protein